MDLLAQMATFVSVVEGKSLSAAARAQRLSLPAVSRQLQALEADLGTNLIVRSTRRLHVTDAGVQWYEHCRRMLRELESARDAIRGSKAVRGTLVISASLTFGSEVIVPQLRRLAQQHPALSIDLRLEDQIVDLVGEGVDVAVRAGSPPPDSAAVFATPLAQMTRILVAAPRWLRKHGTPSEPAQLARHECLIQVTPAGNVIRWAVVRVTRPDETVSIDVQGRLRTNTPTALRDLAVDGAGVAFLPGWLVAEELAQNRLRHVLPDWSSLPITAWAIYRNELRGSARLKAFLDAMPKSLSASKRA
jgi:DNA-binding transcriptional LysR family regulator